MKELSKHDNRIIIIQPQKNIKETLEKVGYPFKSKEHSLKLHEWQQGNRNTKMMDKYLGDSDTRFKCPKSLRYQFSDDFNLKVSQYCCYELKKKPFNKWAKGNKKPIVITGMMKEEGGQRTTLNCIQTVNGKTTKFHPLAKVSHEWEKWFIEKYNIKLCELYYEPYNFERTGCKGCPFNPKLQEDLETMNRLLPNERKQCEIIWKPVYEEYRRINYRLKKEEQTKLF